MMRRAALAFLSCGLRTTRLGEQKKKKQITGLTDFQEGNGFRFCLQSALEYARVQKPTDAKLLQNSVSAYVVWVA